MSEYRQLKSRILQFIDGTAGDSFDDLALAIHAFQKEHCPPLRAYSESICPRPRSWRELPPLPTEAFKNPQQPIAAFSTAEASATFRTSGTTGESRGAHHFLDLELYERSIRAAWAELELPNLRPICLTQPPALASDSSLVHMFATLGGRFVIGSDAVLDPNRLRTLLSQAREQVLLAGTALAFLHHFESEQCLPPLPGGSWVLETGGYKGSGRDVGKQQLYAIIQRELGVPVEQIINEYSMTELSSQFYSIGIGHCHRAPGWMRARVLRPGTDDEVADGERGVIAIYDLANLGSSVAIATRDLAVRRGHEFELIGRDPGALPRGCSRSADELLSQ